MKPPTDKKQQRIYAYSFASIYPLYIDKVKKKGRTQAELDDVLRWLTGYTQKQLESILEKRTNLETFITKARMNPARTLVTGAICGVRVEEVEDRALIFELEDGRGDGDAAALLDGHPVRGGVALGPAGADGAGLLDGAAV